MRKFISKTVVFIIPIILVLGIILSRADGYTDPFYIRFTTPKQHNLILGTSRAAQGLQPQVLKEFCNVDFYNYAFTVGHSPYGPTYLKSIKKKLKTDRKDNIFLITVDPWSISSITEDPNDSINFREVKLCLGNTPFVDLDPNYFYLVKNVKSCLKSILRIGNSSVFLHKNGWLEVSVSMDTASVIKRLNGKIEYYKKNNLPHYKFSSLRFQYLKNTILYLKQYGKVFLIRLPVHKRMLEIEEVLMPDFNEKINQIIPLANGFLDLTPNGDRYQYTDGNHLYKESGKVVSMEIAEWIEKQLDNDN